MDTSQTIRTGGINMSVSRAATVDVGLQRKDWFYGKPSVEKASFNNVSASYSNDPINYPAQRKDKMVYCKVRMIRDTSEFVIGYIWGADNVVFADSAGVFFAGADQIN